jgi:putative Holliday junction resolvase
VGETLLALAHPLTTIAAEQTRDRFDAIASLIDEWQPCLLVVGLPVHMDDSEHALTARARPLRAAARRALHAAGGHGG